MCVCVCVCGVIPFILDVRLVDTQEGGHTGFLIHLHSAVLARRIQPFLSLVDREVEFCVLTDYNLFSTCWAFFVCFFLVRKNPGCKDKTCYSVIFGKSVFDFSRCEQNVG